MAELAKKLFSGFQMGRKLLTTGLGIAHKIRNVYQSAPVKSLISALPQSAQDVLAKGANIGGSILRGAEATQLKLQQAQPVLGAIQQAVQRLEDGGMATKSVELARKSLMPEASQRMPAIVAKTGMGSPMGLQKQAFGAGAHMATFPHGFGNVANPVGMSFTF
jgi:hypothetical protein